MHLYKIFVTWPFAGCIFYSTEILFSLFITGPRFLPPHSPDVTADLLLSPIQASCARKSFWYSQSCWIFFSIIVVQNTTILVAEWWRDAMRPSNTISPFKAGACFILDTKKCAQQIRVGKYKIQMQTSSNSEPNQKRHKSRKSSTTKSFFFHALYFFHNFVA